MPSKLTVQAIAPDFELTDTNGQTIHLAEINRERFVVLVLLRAFV